MKLSAPLPTELIDALADALFLIDQQGRVLDVNRHACESLGLSRSQVLVRTWGDLDRSHEPDRPRRLLEHARAGRPSNFVAQLRRADGQSVRMEMRASALALPDGEGLVLLGRERAAHEAPLASPTEQQARFQAIVENEPECVKILDADCALLDMNPAGIRMIAAESIEQVRGWNTLDLVAPAFRERFRAGVEDVFRGQKTFQVFEIVALDGTRRWMEQHSVPLWDPERPGSVKEMLAVTRDITERKLSEKKQLHQQRLEALGTLAGGIAHDLNNLLAPVMLSMGELAHTPGVDPSLISIVDGSVQRAAAMVRQLLSFSRGLEGECLPLSPAGLLDELVRIIQGSFPKSIELLVAPPANVGHVLGDPTQLHQVLLNLCVNARDAMPEGGTLTLKIETHTLERAREEGSRTLAAGDYVAFVVRDSGEGMSEAVRERIFEPFYTTKGPDQGTGLGLSSALGIVKKHGGWIELESTPGAGSTFRVLLPQVETEAAPQADALEPAALDGRGRCVLLVDDEPAVLKVGQRSLERLGFRVLSAASGEEACSLLDRHAPDVELVISDLRMPGMNGLELLRRAQEQCPRAAQILTTGYLDERSSRELGELDQLRKLEKPYTSEQLAEQLKELFG